MPRSSPAFFIGWRLESGIRYRGVLHILDYKQAQLGNMTTNHVKSVPEKEVIFPDFLEFPFANQRKLAISNMANQPELPDLVTPPAITFEDDHHHCIDAVPPPSTTSPLDLILPSTLPAKTPKFRITDRKMLDHGFTPGCPRCAEPDNEYKRHSKK